MVHGTYLDFFFPRYCPMCGKRLQRDEELVCLHCNIHLPRTGYFSKFDDNPALRLFLSEPRIKRAAALMYHGTGTDSAQIVYSMKYHGSYSACRKMGRLIAYEAEQSGFFDGIDYIIPIPLTRERECHRGYNQTYHIAKGVSDVTGIKVLRSVLLRKDFTESQTRLTVSERYRNVENAFQLRDAETIKGKHVLLLDDVITTGATTMASARQLLKAEDTVVSIVSVGFAGRG